MARPVRPGTKRHRPSGSGLHRPPKPVSCALYPIREKRFTADLTGINYNRWDICRPAVDKGRELGLRVYQFLKEPLIRRFGAPWYEELCEVADQILLELED